MEHYPPVKKKKKKGKKKKKNTQNGVWLSCFGGVEREVNQESSKGAAPVLRLFIILCKRTNCSVLISQLY